MRPADENGFGFMIEQATEGKRLFVLLPEAPLLQEWEHAITT
jgi:hypothetical protein